MYFSYNPPRRLTVPPISWPWPAPQPEVMFSGSTANSFLIADSSSTGGYTTRIPAGSHVTATKTPASWGKPAQFRLEIISLSDVNGEKKIWKIHNEESFDHIVQLCQGHAVT